MAPNHSAIVFIHGHASLHYVSPVVLSQSWSAVCTVILFISHPIWIDRGKKICYLLDILFCHIIWLIELHHKPSFFKNSWEVLGVVCIFGLNALLLLLFFLLILFILKCFCVMTWIKFILIGQTNKDVLSLSKCTSMKPPVTCRMESKIKRMNARSS